MTIVERLKYVVNERGSYVGLYRGLGPGLFRSFVANGCAMVVMQYFQRKVTDWGYRN
jgi:hypothetical protein